MAKNDPLPEKYRKALSLLKDGNLSYGNIADKCGIPQRTLYDLIEGRAEDYGTIGDKFTAALTEIQRARDREIRDLIKKCKKKTFYLIDQFLSSKSKVKVDRHLVSTLTSVANALAKSTPNVEIGSFVYQKGLSAEDIYAEFKRLSALASERRAVSGTSEGGTGEISLAPGPGTPASEEPKDTVL